MASSREFIRCCRATLKLSDRPKGFVAAGLAIRLNEPAENLARTPRPPT